jgi:magnesium-transporting ATPase (P-type)
MLTGDALPIAEAISSQIGLGPVTHGPEDPGELSALLERFDGLAEVLPETKYRAIETLQSQGHIVGMTGDGINDAPSLKAAEVGIAVSTATDAAKAAASVVLTTEGLVGIVDLVENGRAVYQRILTWMINKVSRTVLKSGFVVAAFLITGRFVISAIAMLMIVLMTDFAKIALATDRVVISGKPDTWSVTAYGIQGGVIGAILVAEALFLLEAGVRYFGLSIDSPSVHTFTFFMLLMLALFSILSIRERRHFWASKPGGLLLLALGADALLGSVVAAHGLFELPSLTIAQMALVFVGSAFFALFVNDFIKLQLWNHLVTRGRHVPH